MESSLKMMEKAFILSEKLFSFSRYLTFCPDISVMYRNGLIRKVRLILKFMRSQLGKQTITVYILPNTDNQAMEFGQLIEYNMRFYFF